MAARGRGAAPSGPGRGHSRRPRRRTTRVPSAPDAPVPERTRSKFTKRAAVLLLVLAVLAVSYASSIRAWMRQHEEVNTLHAQIAESKASIADLKQQKRRWHDPAYIKSQARLRFGWLMPGETGYRVIGKNGKVWQHGTDSLTTPKATHPTTEPEWWQPALESMRRAGKTDAQLAAERQRKQEQLKPDHRPPEKIKPPQ